jgi:hypothetical protein
MSRIEKLNDATGQGEFLDEIVPVKYLFSTNTASTASDGDLQFDDATYSSAANIYVNKTNFNAVDIEAILLDFQNGGIAMVGSTRDATRIHTFRIDGDPVLNTDTITIPVTYLQGGTGTDFDDEETIYLTSFAAPVSGGSSEFGDDVFRVIDNGDNTKKIAFEASSITTATVRTVTMPDTDVDLGDIATNNAKVTNATHTGDATGATALTLATVNSDVGSYVKPTLTVNAKGLVTAVTSEIMGGLVVTSTSTTNVSNGSYNVLEDTTALTSVSSGIGQDSDWTLEVTQTGITNQKGRVSAVIKCEKTGGAGRQYDFAIFKNGSIISDSEMTDLTLENNDTWSNIKCTAPVEFSTGDLFSLRVSGNGTGDDIECTNGTIYIQ